MPYKDKDKQAAYDKAYLESHRKIAAERSRKHYHTNKEAHKKNCVIRRRNWENWARDNDPKELILRRTKNSASQRGLEHTISKEDFNIPEYCPILGIKLVMNIGKPRNNSPSMDRINNDKGYIPGNVCIISKEANRMKSNHTKESLDKLIDYISNPDKYRKLLDN